MIFFITNKSQVTHNALLMKIRAAALAGVDYVLLRENDLTDEAYYDLALSVLQMLTGSDTELVICHRPHVAEKLGLKQHARFSECGEQTFSVSTHSKAELMRVHPDQFAFYGNVFETNCKPGLAPKGIDLLRCHPKTIALGGVNLENLPRLKGHVDHIGIMSEWLEVPHLKAYVTYLRKEGY